MPRNKLRLNLSKLEKRELENLIDNLAEDPKTSQRCRIILMTENGLPLQQIADTLGLSKTTVNAWRQIFLSRRIEGLTKRKRPGRPQKSARGIMVRPYGVADDAARTPEH
jgi:DNA-binding CsgD family transcriptional regulator